MILKSIIGTFSNKLLTTVLSFILVVVSSQLLGASGKGEISLFIANIVFVQHVGNLISGTAIVYLTPRIKPILLLIPAYLWAILSGVFVSYILYLIDFTSERWLLHLIILSIIYNLLTTNYMVLLGREKIKSYNLLTLFTVLITLLFFIASYFNNNNVSSMEYVKALYVAYSLILLMSLYSIKKEFVKFQFSELPIVIEKVVKYGFTAQLSNIITFINYRFSYYVLNLLFDSSVVGVFSVGVAISEAMWLMSKSIALVQYTKIVNEDDISKANEMTFKMTKLSFWITLSFIFVMLLMPDIFYNTLFGAEFIESKFVIYSLSLGILSIAVSTTFSHYFGGFGRFNVNNIASIIGLLFTLSLTYFLSQKYGMVGAGISASISYFASAIYLFLRFKKDSGFKLSYLIPTKNDIKNIKRFYNFK